MNDVFLHAPGIICALGSGVPATAAALFSSDPRANDLPVGAVRDALPALDEFPVAYGGRNSALLFVALQQIRAMVDAALARFGAARVAVILGTSTSGVGESEAAHRHRAAHGTWPAAFHYAQQEMGTPSAFIAHVVGATGPAYTISTACSSSAKALAAAARLLRSGQVDAVVCGGADSLCDFTRQGFSALGAVSATRCNPFSRLRDGINVGEGAALFLATREPAAVRLSGWGESSDAHHMSAPDPTGLGPEAALRAALQRAALDPSQIDYVNLHGTATLQNDAMESALIARVFDAVPCSSSKPLTGHALGAAGAIEAALCWIALAHNAQHALPPHWWDGTADPALPPLALAAPGARAARPLRHVLSQSFAFGGSNAALILSAA
jgi:3-oxoacyl-[acyl-carrier-protein] synthase-1